MITFRVWFKGMIYFCSRREMLRATSLSFISLTSLSFSSCLSPPISLSILVSSLVLPPSLCHCVTLPPPLFSSLSVTMPVFISLPPPFPFPLPLSLSPSSPPPPFWPVPQRGQVRCESEWLHGSVQQTSQRWVSTLVVTVTFSGCVRGLVMREDIAGNAEESSLFPSRVSKDFHALKMSCCWRQTWQKKM